MSVKVNVFHKGEVRNGQLILENRIYVLYEGNPVSVSEQLTSTQKILEVIQKEPGKWILVYIDESKRIANPWDAAKKFRELAEEMNTQGGTIIAVSKKDILIDLLNNLLKSIVHIEIQRFETEAEMDAFLSKKSLKPDTV